MKLFSLVPALAALTASVSARTYFASWPLNGVTIGETHNLVWFSNAPEHIIQLSLVRHCDYINDPEIGNCLWTVVENLSVGMDTNAPGGRLTWTVSDEHEPGDGYALFIISEPAHIHKYPFLKGRPGQTEETTPYFSIKAPMNFTQVLEGMRTQVLEGLRAQEL